MKIAFLGSGNLGFKCLQSVHKNVEIVSVLTDANSTEIINWSQEKDIPVFRGNPRSGKTSEFIRDKEVDVLLSVNYLFLIDQDLINWPRKYAINIHGSLLPKYRGRTPHVWAVINNEMFTGFTIHQIDVGCDTGGIILQREIPISLEMTGADILNKFSDLYPQAINEVLELIEKNKVEVIQQDERKATYYGKRTPEDGDINWNWQKERIINWVRAQAYPYPGAFSYYDGRKIVINKMEPDDYGFHFEDRNGLILDVTGQTIVVKTPNGALRILDWEMEDKTLIKKGDYLYGRH